jgi:hypothetical protein
MCVKQIAESLPIASGDVDRIIAAIIAVGAEGDAGKIWDITEGYDYALELQRRRREQASARRRVRKAKFKRIVRGQYPRYR